MARYLMQFDVVRMVPGAAMPLSCCAHGGEEVGFDTIERAKKAMGKLAQAYRTINMEPEAVDQLRIIPIMVLEDPDALPDIDPDPPPLKEQCN